MSRGIGLSETLQQLPGQQVELAEACLVAKRQPKEAEISRPRSLRFERSANCGSPASVRRKCASAQVASLPRPAARPPKNASAARSVLLLAATCSRVLHGHLRRTTSVRPRSRRRPVCSDNGWQCAHRPQATAPAFAPRRKWPPRIAAGKPRGRQGALAARGSKSVLEREHVNPQAARRAANLPSRNKVSESLTPSLGFLYGLYPIDWEEG